MAKVTASILGTDFLNLEEQIGKVQDADFLHFDVMDGHFVPNLSFGSNTFKMIREAFPDLKVEVHLMTKKPEKFIDLFPDPYITLFHPTATEDIAKLLQALKERDGRAGIALNPDEDFETIKPFVRDIDLVLVMGFYAGFSGRKLRPEIIDKIKMIRKEYDSKIEIDGGVNQETARMFVDAGVDILVSGNFLFSAPSKNLDYLKSL
jgi:ribulose-phosphate 3-epimerase